MEGKPSQTKAGIEGVGLLRAKIGSVKGGTGGMREDSAFHSLISSLLPSLSFAMGVELLFDGHCRLKYGKEKLGSSAVLLIYF